MDDRKAKNCLKSGLSIEQARGREILREISKFVWNKYNEGALIDEQPDNIKLIHTELDNYCITDCAYNETTGDVELKTARPGVVIGVKGENIYAIEKWLKKWAQKEGTPFSKIKIKEDITPIWNDIHYSEYCYVSWNNYEDDRGMDDFEEPDWDSD